MNDLTTTEQGSLAKLEGIIGKGLSAFYEVGSALLTIRDSRLYRGAHATFEAYCLDRWKISRPRAYQLIDAAKVKENLSTIVDIPATESQARPLASLPPEQQATAWQKAVDTAPLGRVTAAHVTTTIKAMTGKKRPGVLLEREEDTDAVFHLKRWWRKATKKDKGKFSSWILEEDPVVYRLVLEDVNPTHNKKKTLLSR